MNGCMQAGMHEGWGGAVGREDGACEQLAV